MQIAFTGRPGKRQKNVDINLLSPYSKAHFSIFTPGGKVIAVFCLYKRETLQTFD